MKFGLHLPNFGAFGDAQLLADLALDAEQEGWDGFFIWDQIGRPWPTAIVDPWIALAAIALKTQRIRLGALVTPLPRRRPWKVARETISLDHLAKGRLIFGAGIGGSGGRQVEWAHLGEEMDLKSRGAMLDEGLEIISGLWSGRQFSFEGQHYKVKDSQFLPRSLQKPRIPIWVGGYWPNKPPFRRAAKWDGAIPYLFADRGDLLTQFREVKQYTEAKRVDDGPYDLAFIAAAQPNESRAKAAEAVSLFAEAGATWWIEEVTPIHFGGDWEGEWPLAKMRAYIREGPPR